MKKYISLLTFSTLLSIIPSTLIHADEERGLLSSALMSESFAEKTKLDISGFASSGFTINTQNSDGYNGPVSFNDRANEAQLDQLYLSIKRSTDSDALSLGGKVDILYGPDAVYTQSLGFDNKFTNDDTSQYYKLAIPQAYLELQTGLGNGLSIKAGHFYTLIGYETVPSNENFFYSHAYTMQYAEPFTHWGALTSYQLSDEVTVTGGAVRGWDNLEDPNDGNLSFLGSVGITPSEDTSITFSLISGNEGVNTQRNMYSFVFVKALSDEFKYVLQHDFGYQEGIDGADAAKWFGVNNYVIYHYTDMVDFGARLEWFRDDDGTRVVGVRSGAGGVPADYYAASVAANVHMNNHLLLRPEVRIDHQDLRKGASQKAFDNGNEDYQVLLSGNAIVTF